MVFKKNIIQRTYILNFIASVINALEAVIILMVASRTVGLEDSGVLSISFTLANLFMCVGKFGMRGFQVSDSKYEFSAASYFRSRYVTCLLMLIVLGVYLAGSYLISGYSVNKVLVILFVSLIYGVEALEDVFLSEFQHRARLDIGLSMFSIRWSVTITVWAILLIVSKNSLISVTAAFFVDLIIFLLLMKSAYPMLSRDSSILAEKSKNVLGLLKKCLPLCISALLSMYLPHCARYAIDRYMDDSSQAIFSFIAMPIFAISLAATIVFQPMVKNMADIWNNREYKLFKKKSILICGIVFLISVFALVSGYFLEVPVLSFLYATDLTSYKTEMMILLIAGSVLAYISFFGTVLVIFRLQKFMMSAYLIVSAVSFSVIKFFITRYGLLGATIGNMLLLLMVAVILFVGVMLHLRKSSVSLYTILS